MKKEFEYYDPKTDKYPYPIDTCAHYLVNKKDDHTVFDKNYPYIDKSKKFLRKRRLIRFICKILAFPLTRIRFGLRVYGKEKLRQNKEIIKKGIISISNHVHMWDYLAILASIKNNVPNVLSWAPNIRSENAKLIRSVGGIPIPENDLAATITYLREVEKYLNDGGWLHISAEGSMWEFYRPIRPFKKGTSYFAVKCNKPILPICFTYRKPNWIRRVIFKQIATFDLHFGDLLYPDLSLESKERENELLIRAHKELCKLAGYKENENPYEPIYNNSKRIDYYTSEYGKGYKR